VTSARPGRWAPRPVGSVHRVTRALRILIVAAALTVTACSSSSGVTLEPNTAPAVADASGGGASAVTGQVSCPEIGAGERTASDTSGCRADPARLVPAIGYECADGSMVYSTDTSHGRDGERWAVAYHAADELEQRC
jgi:hypothetical protein